MHKMIAAFYIVFTYFIFPFSTCIELPVEQIRREGTYDYEFIHFRRVVKQFVRSYFITNCHCNI